MHCSTNLQISPIIPRLPRVWALLLIVSLLVRTTHPMSITQGMWLPVITVPCAHWRRRKASCYSVPSVRWVHLLPRLLARCALLSLLLHTSGWLQVTPLSWGVLLLPVAQMLRRTFMLHAVTLAPERLGSPLGGSAGEPKRVRWWANNLQRLYQLLFVALLVSTLGQLLRLLYASATGLPFLVFLGTWCTQPDEETELSVTTVDKDRYQVTLRGTFNLVWEPRDSFERWICILFLRKLRRPGAPRPFLTQSQVAQAFAPTNARSAAGKRWFAATAGTSFPTATVTNCTVPCPTPS